MDEIVKIHVVPECANAPKKTVLRDFNIAFVKRKSRVLLESVTEDFVWNIVGEKTIVGKEQFAKALEEMAVQRVMALRLDHLLTHGKEGAASGEMQMVDGTYYAFSDVYIFSGAKGAKIRRMSSYVIKLAR